MSQISDMSYWVLQFKSRTFQDVFKRLEMEYETKQTDILYFGLYDNVFGDIKARGMLVLNKSSTPKAVARYLSGFVQVEASFHKDVLSWIERSMLHPSYMSIGECPMDDCSIIREDDFRDMMDMARTGSHHAFISRYPMQALKYGPQFIMWLDFYDALRVKDEEELDSDE